MHDYIIVGGGMAGTLLSYLLDKMGKDFKLIDENDSRSSTLVSGGLINPVTGRRLVKSWMYDELASVFLPFYKSLETDLGVSIFHPTRLYRQVKDNAAQNLWDSKSGISDYAPFLSKSSKLSDCEGLLKNEQQFGEIKQVYKVDWQLAIQHLHSRFHNEQRLLKANFDHSKLNVRSDHINYLGLKAKRVIFCEGAAMRFNPWFSYIPLQPAKGEMLSIQIPETRTLDLAVKQRYTLLPTGKKFYWVGSNYEHKNLSLKPTDDFLHQVTQHLNANIKPTYNLHEHKAAIRPSSHDRKPYLGVHPKHTNMFILNGLGTKGSSLTPYWASHMLAYLENDMPLSAKVDIKRI